MRTTLLATIASCAIGANGLHAQITTTSPAGGSIPSGVSVVGGIVTDLVGLNGNRVVAQLAASTLYQGYAGSNPFTVGTQTGFSAAVLGALGGGITEAAFRFTLYDGDTSPGDFDYNDNTLLLNGFNFGNWSNVSTAITNSTGTVSGTTTGFTANLLNTGWFYSNNSGLLSSLFASLTSTSSLAFQVNDVDPYDNYYDFKQGINNLLIDVGTGPVVQPPSTVPEPMSMALLGTGLAGLGAMRRRRKSQEETV